MTAPRRRILFFAGGSYVFGAEIIILDLLRGLRGHGHDVRCVVSGWNDGDFIQRLQAIGVPYYTVKLGFTFLTRPAWTLDSLAHYPGALRALARIRREFDPEIVYYHGYRSLLMAPWLFPARKVLVHVMETQATSARTRLLYRAMARRARRVIAISHFIARDLADKGVPAQQIDVTHPAVDIESAHTLPRAEHDGPPRIGIVGQLIPRKGHGVLLEALSRVAASGHPFELHVFGRGPEDWTRHLHDLAERLGLAPHVRWHGFVRDRGAIYPELDMVVVPTQDEEAFGLVAAEPALWGLPVVASDGGGLPEIVVDGETGLLFRRGEADALARQLSRLLADRALGARLGEAARARVRERFSLEAATQAFERVAGVR